MTDAARDRFPLDTKRRGSGRYLRLLERDQAVSPVSDAQENGEERSARERELRDFFARCDREEGPGDEPDWEEALAIIEATREEGAADS